MGVTHHKISGVPSSGDASLIQGPDWNANHDQDAAGILGSDTVGPVKVLPLDSSLTIKGDGSLGVDTTVISTAPSGPAGADLSGTYPNPLIRPSPINGYVLTTIAGVATWTPVSTSANPVGPAGGDLAGSYPNPTIKASVGLTGAPTAPTIITGASTDLRIANVASIVNQMNAVLPNYAPLASPVFTGTPTTPTGTGTPVLQVANAQYVSNQLSAYNTSVIQATYLPLAGGTVTGTLTVNGSAAPAAGGALGNGLLMSSTANFGVAFGSGAPNKAFARGSMYLRSDGPPGPYLNTDGTSTGWQPIGGSVSVGDSPPASPLDGQLWWKSDTGVLYIRYLDPSGPPSQWVQATPAVQSAAGALTLYSEVVATAGASEMRVSVPLNCKRIELESYVSASSGDPSSLLQTVEGSTPNATNNHQGTSLTGTGTTATASTSTIGTTWTLLGAGLAWHSIKMFPRLTTNSWSGIVSANLFTTGSARYIAALALDGGANPATTTGFRLTLSAGTFNAGSFFRAFVVM